MLVRVCPSSPPIGSQLSLFIATESSAYSLSASGVRYSTWLFQVALNSLSFPSPRKHHRTR